MTGRGLDENQELIRFLEAPDTHGGAEVERIDTHASHVFLAGDRAYKLKRPVSYPFMDFSTLEKREAAVRHELELNRRTAPNLYLAVAAVRRTKDGFFIDEGASPSEDVVDWLVVMRRFEQSALLSAIAERGELADVHVDSLRDAIVRFHEESDSLELDWPAAMKWVVEDNVAELEDYREVFDDKDTVARANVFMPEFLSRHDALLAQRSKNGRIKPCHGDLHLGNVAYLDGRATLFDALEFNESLANIDTLYDSAFVLMDLLARRLVTQSFRLFNGLLDRNRDEAGLSLLPLYLATRALIRAKVAAALAYREDNAEAKAQANHYLGVARPILETPAPVLVAIGGLSGSGKSTVARLVGPDLGVKPGARWLRSDVIRKLQHGLEEHETLPSSAYGPGTSGPVYREMLDRARTALDCGYSVILDAVFARGEERDRADALAEELGVPFHGFWLEAPLKVRKERVAARRDDASDADVRVVDLQEETELGEIRWHRVQAGPTSPQVILDRVREAEDRADRS